MGPCFHGISARVEEDCLRAGQKTCLYIALGIAYHEDLVEATLSMFHYLLGLELYRIKTCFCRSFFRSYYLSDHGLHAHQIQEVL